MLSTDIMDEYEKQSEEQRKKKEMYFEIEIDNESLINCGGGDKGVSRKNSF